MDGYVTVEGPAVAEFSEKRSRFISEIRPVESEREFAAFLAEKRSKYWDASHHCSAFLLREGGVQRYSDDGEPQGSAGTPILEVLRREGLENCAVIVTRYFGGTLLGVGGLVRAYARATALAVAAAARMEICRCADISLAVDYALYDRVNLLLQECGAVVLDADFGARVTLQARLRSQALAPFVRRLTELSGGRAAPEFLAETFAPMPGAAGR